MTKKKTCTKCKEEKTTDQFYKDDRARYGVQSICKLCCRLSKKKYYEENREKMRERNRRYYEENREKNIERVRRYNEENREKTREKLRRYNEENRENRRMANRKTMARYQAISNAMKTKSGRWSDDEVSELLDNYDKMTSLELALHLGRGYNSVQGKIQLLKNKAIIQ